MKYVLQVSGSISEPRWQTDVHASTDAEAIESVEQYARHSVVIRNSHRMTLWEGERPVRSWSVDAATVIKAETTNQRNVGQVYAPKFQTEVKA